MQACRVTLKSIQLDYSNLQCLVLLWVNLKSVGCPKDELQLFWQAIDQAISGGGSLAAGGNGIASSAVLSHSIANVLRLLILTGVRRSEAAEMRWDQIDGDRWTIPETKNGKSHIVTLHPLALSLLKRQRILSESTYVFESTSKPGSPITGDAITRALKNEFG